MLQLSSYQLANAKYKHISRTLSYKDLWVLNRRHSSESITRVNVDTHEGLIGIERTAESRFTAITALDGDRGSTVEINTIDLEKWSIRPGYPGDSVPVGLLRTSYFILCSARDWPPGCKTKIMWRERVCYGVGLGGGELNGLGMFCLAFRSPKSGEGVVPFIGGVS